MYSPSFYRVEDENLIHGLIKDYPFALLTTSGSDELSHLPLIIEKAHADEWVLTGHMARANPHWKNLSSHSFCKAVFQGPHGYISPAWYTPKEDNVPTWNYTAVHVTGKFEIISDKKQAFDTIDRMVKEFERKYQTHWTLPHDQNAISELLKSIVVFQIRGLKFEGKFKLSQKQDSVNRENVIQKLVATGEQELIKLAEKMKLRF